MAALFFLAADWSTECAAELTFTHGTQTIKSHSKEHLMKNKSNSPNGK